MLLTVEKLPEQKKVAFTGEITIRVRGPVATTKKEIAAIVNNLLGLYNGPIQFGAVRVSELMRVLASDKPETEEEIDEKEKSKKKEECLIEASS